MSSTQQSKLENINDKSKLTVQGYVKGVQSILPTAKNIFYNIPTSINQIILLFYFVMDEFELYPSNCYKISQDYRTVKMIRHKYPMLYGAFGKIGIHSESNLRCYWTVKITKEAKLEQMSIELIPNKTSDIFETYGWRWRRPCYSFHNTGANCRASKYASWIRRDPDGTTRKYGERFKKGDVITMYLDLTEKQISFVINDKNYGIAFRNIITGPNIIYYFGVEPRGVGQEITLIDFDYY